jgi:hypothetical protein
MESFLRLESDAGMSLKAGIIRQTGKISRNPSAGMF